MSSCSRDDPYLSPEFCEASAREFQQLAREHQKKFRASELRVGRRAGRRWADRQATALQLQRLEQHRIACDQQSKSSWKDSFEHIYRTKGTRAVADYVACLVLGEPVDDEIADEFWEIVFADANPFLERPAEYFRGFAEGALKSWSTAEGQHPAANRRSLDIGSTPRPEQARFVLCVDQHDYCKVLHAELRHGGGRVIKANWENASQKLIATQCDFAIFDVRAYPSRSEAYASISEIFPPAMIPWQPSPTDAPTPDRYAIIREISNSAWGQEHAIIVYSFVSRDLFQEQAVARGINLTRVRFYHKGNREIPPELDCIRQTIVARPSLIGFYFSDEDTPQAITQEFIDREPIVYPLIELYMTRLVQEWKGDDERRLFDTLPPGYLMVYLFWRFFSDVNNGGFEQFLGNALAIDESGQLIVETVEALRRVGLVNVAEMTQEVIRLSAANLPEAVVKACVIQPRRKTRFKSRYPANHPDPIERLIDALTVEFNEIESTFDKALEAYVKKHPHEFIHKRDVAGDAGKP